MIGRAALCLALALACSCAPADREGANTTHTSNVLSTDFGTGRFFWGAAWAADIAQHPNGNVIVTGQSTFTLFPDIVIFSVGASGLSWARSWNSGSIDKPAAVAVAPDGGIYVTGSVSQIGPIPPTPGLPDPPPLPEAPPSMVLLKLDSSGNGLWSRAWTNGLPAFAAGVAVDASGNVFVVGRAFDCTAQCALRIALAKLTPGGDQLWAKTYASQAAQDNAASVAVDASGNAIVLGQGSDDVNLQGGTVLIFKTDPDGNILWGRGWGSSGAASYSSTVATDAAGDIYVAGNGAQTAALIKLAPDDGRQMWAMAEATPSGAVYDGVAVDGQGGVVISGWNQVAANPQNLVDRFDANGGFRERQTWTQASADMGPIGGGVAVGPTGNVLIVTTATNTAGSWAAASPTMTALGDQVSSSTITTQPSALSLLDFGNGIQPVPNNQTGNAADGTLIVSFTPSAPSSDGGAPSSDGGATGEPRGQPCVRTSDCQSSDVCVDSVCCRTSCPGGANDCQACSTAAGGTLNGECTPVVAGQACTGTDFCDAATVCTGTATTCKDSALATNMCLAPSEDPLHDCGYFDPSYPACVPLDGWPSVLGSALVKMTAPYAGRIKLVEAGGDCQPPPGFEVVGTGHYWEFETDPAVPLPPPPADGSDLFNICFTYSDAWFTGLEDNLFIKHGTTGSCSSGWDTLTGKTVDKTNNIICANSPSLSPFTLVEPLPSSLPVVTVPADMTAAATSAAGAVVSFDASAVDPQDGPLAVTCTPASGSLFPVGATSVTCTAVDSRQIIGSATFSVGVRYDAPTDGTFFAQPINPDGSSIFKAGSTVPVKFSLTGASAQITNLAARISVARISNGITGSYVETTSNAAPDGGSLFRYSSGQYIYNLSTKGMATGTWSIRVDLGDGVPHAIVVSLR
jgi:hypothetical protein